MISTWMHQRRRISIENRTTKRSGFSYTGWCMRIRLTFYNICVDISVQSKSPPPPPPHPHAAITAGGENHNQNDQKCESISPYTPASKYLSQNQDLIKTTHVADWESRYRMGKGALARWPQLNRERHDQHLVKLI